MACASRSEFAHVARVSIARRGGCATAGTSIASPSRATCSASEDAGFSGGREARHSSEQTRSACGTSEAASVRARQVALVAELELAAAVRHVAAEEAAPAAIAIGTAAAPPDAAAVRHQVARAAVAARATEASGLQVGHLQRGACHPRGDAARADQLPATARARALLLRAATRRSAAGARRRALRTGSSAAVLLESHAGRSKAGDSSARVFHRCAPAASGAAPSQPTARLPCHNHSGSGNQQRQQSAAPRSTRATDPIRDGATDNRAAEAALVVLRCVRHDPLGRICTQIECECECVFLRRRRRRRRRAYCQAASETGAQTKARQQVASASASAVTTGASELAGRARRRSRTAPAPAPESGAARAVEADCTELRGARYG